MTLASSLGVIFMSSISDKKFVKETKIFIDKGLSDVKDTFNNIDVNDAFNTLKNNMDESIKTVSIFGTVAAENVKNKTTEFIENSKKRLEKEKDEAKANQETSKSENVKSSETMSETKKEKKISIDEMLKNAIDDYNSIYEVMNASGMELHYERERSIDLIEFVEDLVNSIANKPKSFEKDFEEISTSKKTFKDADDFMKKDLATVKKQAAGAGVGVAAGAGVVAFAPSAAMWVATTFGTASTGTAISALSGAAATNAALAWLGGGALAASGGGMAAGQAFLALAGPVGWGIAGASLLVSVLLFANNKLKSNKEKEKEIESIKSNTSFLRKTIANINSLTEKNNSLREQLSNQYKDCVLLYNIDYETASDEQKMSLGALVNNTKSLSKLITLTINCETNEGD